MQLPEVQTYKSTPQGDLDIHIFRPQEESSGCAVVFFFGGGWRQGNIEQFYPQSRALAERGMVCFCADYRVASRHGTTPIECVEDAQSAVNWIAEHAEEFQIDPSKIAAAGGSAGGHLAACTSLVPSLSDSDTDTVTMARPAALVLFNPAVAFAALVPKLKTGLKYSAQDICPLSQLKTRQFKPVPTIVFHGEADDVVPIIGCEAYVAEQIDQGQQALLVRYPDEEHGFFNLGRGDGSAYDSTLGKTINFLDELGYLI